MPHYTLCLLTYDLVNTGLSYAIPFGKSLPALAGGHQAWRYTVMSGVIPAIPLILIRPFLPESPAWQEKKAAGTLKRPSFAELFQPAFNKTTWITTLMFACSYGAAFGAILMPLRFLLIRSISAVS